MSLFSYLALGDSYTIGEGVLLHDSFPYQLVKMLRNIGLPFAAPEIIATTGWRTDELRSAMEKHTFLDKYHFVTILIGVNNQYQHQPVEEYKPALERLLQRALELADGKAEAVAMISIPDYGVTPFAANLDRELIGREIDIYNNIGKALTLQYKVHHLDITPLTRTAQDEPALLAADGLHPSSLLYQQWAEQLSPIVANCLKK
jgi:lysophospholipase L1-like esterase